MFPGAKRTNLSRRRLMNKGREEKGRCGVVGGEKRHEASQCQENLRGRVKHRAGKKLGRESSSILGNQERERRNVKKLISRLQLRKHDRKTREKEAWHDAGIRQKSSKKKEKTKDNGINSLRKNLYPPAGDPAKKETTSQRGRDLKDPGQKEKRTNDGTRQAQALSYGPKCDAHNAVEDLLQKVITVLKRIWGRQRKSDLGGNTNVQGLAGRGPEPS